MAQAPIENHSIHTASETPRAQGAISYTKEKAKQELFKAISDQNTQYGAWQKGISDWYEEKVKKFEKRGSHKEKAQELASKQIQKVWAKVFQHKLATPGTQRSDGVYKNIGDSDGEGAIFLMKKFIFGKKQSFTNYMHHQEIEENAQSANLKDEKVLQMFLDGGGVPGVTISSGETTGLLSPWKKTKMVVDHHPEGPTSTSGMVAKLLEIAHLIPEPEKKAVEKFVSTIDIVDSFLSRSGRTINVEKDYAKTLIAFSYQLDSDELYKVCAALPDDIGPLTPLPDSLLDSMEVTMKEKKDKVKLRECVNKKQANIDTGVQMLQEKIKQKQHVSMGGKKFLIFGPKDNISNDVRAVLCAEHDYGTIKIHPTGDIFMVHDQGIPQNIRELGLTVRDVIFLLNPKVAKKAFDEAKKLFLENIPEGEGKIYLMTLLNTTQPEEKKGIAEEVKTKETFAEKVAESPLPPSIKAEVAKKVPVMKEVAEQKIESKIEKAPKKSSPSRLLQDIKKDLALFGKDLKSVRSSFTKRIKGK